MSTAMQKIVVIYQILQELWWVSLLGPTVLILMGRKSIRDLRNNGRFSSRRHNEEQ